MLLLGCFVRFRGFGDMWLGEFLGRLLGNVWELVQGTCGGFYIVFRTFCGGNNFLNTDEKHIKHIKPYELQRFIGGVVGAWG